MLGAVWKTVVPLLAVMVLGCDRPDTAGPPPPTTSPVGQHPAHPASRPTHSTLLIGAREVRFPAARVVLQQSEPTLKLLLFTDEARSALSPGYSGNRYYLQLSVPAEDLAALPATPWVFEAGSMTRVESPDGIFLEGDRKQLQPHKVRIDFSLADGELTLDLHGEFLMFDMQEETAPVKVEVRGHLTAQLEQAGRGLRPDVPPSR